MAISYGHPHPAYISFSSITLPDWLLANLGQYRERVEKEAVKWEFTRNNRQAVLYAHITLYGGETISFGISDEFLINCIPQEEWPSVPPLPKLETFYSPWPVLGWRGWGIALVGLDTGAMQGFYGRTWKSPLHVAECPKGPLAPHYSPGDRCGIYLLKDPEGLQNEGFRFTGLCVATNIIEHQHGYRAGVVRCIGISSTPSLGFENIYKPLPETWSEVPLMPPDDLIALEKSLLADPDSIPAP